MSLSTVELIAEVTVHIWKPLRLEVFVENSQMLNQEQIPSCVSHLVLNGMTSSSFTTNIHSESLFHPSFHSPKANYSSETLGENQGGGVDCAG